MLVQLALIRKIVIGLRYRNADSRIIERCYALG